MDVDVGANGGEGAVRCFRGRRVRPQMSGQDRRWGGRALRWRSSHTSYSCCSSLCWEVMGGFQWAGCKAGPLCCDRRDLFIYWLIIDMTSISKKNGNKNWSDIDNIDCFSVSGLWPLAKKGELFHEKNLSTFPVFCFVVPTKLSGTSQNSTKQSSRVKKKKPFFLDMFFCCWVFFSLRWTRRTHPFHLWVWQNPWEAVCKVPDGGPSTSPPPCSPPLE